MIDFYTKAVSRKIAKVCMLAAKNGYDPYDFMRAFLRSDTFQRLIDMNVCEIGQSAFYHLNSFLMEQKAPFVRSPGGYNDYVCDVMYWAGYLFGYWCFQDGITGRDICSHYDTDRVIGAYDTLHTLSCKNAIEDIQNDFRKAA